MNWTNYFAKDYAGPPFELFGPGHLAFIVFFILFNLSFIYIRRIKDETFRRNFRYGMAIATLIIESVWHTWKLAIGEWTMQEMLPFHLCSMFVFVNVAMLITRNKTLYEFSYLLGIAGALQAVLTPNAGIYGIPHVRAVQTILAHGLLLSEPIYLTVVEGFRPTWASFPRVLIGANLYMVAVYGLNLLIGSNFMYVMHKPETASLMDMLGPWPWYLLAVEAIGLVMMLILYLPFIIMDWRKKRQPQPA